MNQPEWYTNGLCEKHFYSIDFSTNDDENLAVSKNENDFSSQGVVVRQTREIFDGEKW